MPQADPVPLRIAFVSHHDHRKRDAWSGTVHYMARALERQAREVVFLSPIRSPWEPLLEKGAEALRRLTRGRFVVSPHHTWVLSRAYGRRIEAGLRRLRPDLVVAPAASTELASLRTDVPVVYTSDATVRRILDYYPQFSNVLEGSIRRMEAMERAAIRTAALLTYPSPWAAESAVEHYGADPARIVRLSYGANLDTVPTAEEALGRRLALRRASDRCRLLFIGKEWERKGGPLAVEALRALRASGVDAELAVVGARPAGLEGEPGLRLEGFLSKSDPAQAKRFRDLLLESSFFFVPTRQECYGVVFCEAAAHGMPVVTTATGGTPGAVVEGESGFLLPPEAEGAAYAERIRAVFSDPDTYERQVRLARAAYDRELNWDAWARGVLEAALGKGLAGARSS
jgi:glycosyltransferase involved in cell wall biosynthesis